MDEAGAVVTEVRLAAMPEDADAIEHAQAMAIAASLRSVIDNQMGSFPGSPKQILMDALGPERYQRLVNDLAGNIVQGLL